MNLLVTGGLGFIGSHFIRHILRTDPQARVVNYDKITYAGNPANLADCARDPRYEFIKADICDGVRLRHVLALGFDAVVHFAAESHVDRSLSDAAPFIQTNIAGTQMLLEALLECGKTRMPRLVHISTDEVMGSLGPGGFFTEESPLAPNNPYAASKAAGELLVRAAIRSFGLDAAIARPSNNYGPYQHPEKFIPTMIRSALESAPLPVYGDGRYVRDWLFVEDCCRGVDALLRRGRSGEVYNLSGRGERKNIDVARRILHQLGRPDSLLTSVKDRPGHDRRYASDPAKIESELGWTAQVSFEEGLAATIDWYRDHREWIAAAYAAR